MLLCDWTARKEIRPPYLIPHPSCELMLSHDLSLSQIKGMAKEISAFLFSSFI
jgi:hypothetical protein